jgi:hypothetical protein
MANPANYQSYDLMISVSPGDHWAGASIIGTLSHGTFYVPPKSDSDIGLQAAVSQFRPYLTYGTFVSKPGYDQTDVSILGNGSGVQGMSAIMPKSNNSRNTIDVAFGDVHATDRTTDGIQAIARLTMSNDFLAGPATVFTGVLKVTSDPNAPNPYSFTLQLPEPGSLAMMSIGVGAIALRRRK